MTPKRPLSRRIPWSVVRRVAAALGLLLLLNVFAGRRSPWALYQPGDIPHVDLVAPITFDVAKNPSLLDAEQAAARGRVPPVLRLDEQSQQELRARARQLTADLATAERLAIPGPDLAILRRPGGPGIVEIAARACEPILARGFWPDRPAGLTGVILRAANLETREDARNLLDRAQADSIIARTLDRTGLPDDARHAARTVIALLLVPNVSPDTSETGLRRERAAAAVPNYRERIPAGTRIAAAGLPLDASTVERLRALDLALRGRVSPLRALVADNLGYLLLLTAAALYLALRRSPILADERALYLVLSVLALTVLLTRAAALRTMLLAPLPLAGLMTGLLLGLEPGVLVVALLAAAAGFWASPDSILALPLLLAGLGAVFTTPAIRTRSHFYRPFLASTVAGLVGLTTLALAQGGRPAPIEVAALVAGCLAGSFGALLLLPVWERAFRRWTDISLVTLTNLNRFIFQALAMEAPGTYHHSIVVGNLAEAGARAIGANPILARAGGYYHDLGKMKMAEYFIENQSGSRNPHDRLTPKMSALIIAAHTKEGVELGRRANLPQAILDIMLEHHGTTRMESFYRKARTNQGAVDEYEFRYPGPRPRTREAALVMLADAVEAAAHAARSTRPALLRKLVEETVEERFRDGQLDECAVTRPDIVHIKEAFFPILVGSVHARVGYDTRPAPPPRSETRHGAAP